MFQWGRRYGLPASAVRRYRSKCAGRLVRDFLDGGEEARVAGLSDGPNGGAAKHGIGMTQQGEEAGDGGDIAQLVQAERGIGRNALMRVAQRGAQKLIQAVCSGATR